MWQTALLSGLVSGLLWLAGMAGHPAALQYRSDQAVIQADTNRGVEAVHEALDGDAPNPFVSRGTARVVPGAEYDAGLVRRWLLGSHYRDVWTTPLDVPIIDLDETAGGLTPLERGGGNQTTSLHFKGDDGHFYVLRSVNKAAAPSMPERYRGTVLEGIAQDQTSALNPVGAMIVPPLAKAAGVLHTHPILVVVPDTPRLGEFRDEFAGMLALFERKPDEDQSDAARFGFSKNVVGSEKLFEELGEDSDHRVDERAYARARLFDMLIGDWDRHEDQWRWAEFETERGMRYVPVARDRDFAFVKFDGMLNRIGRISGNMTLRRLVDFQPDVPDVLALNWQGFELDRRLTASLTRNDWVDIADSLREALPDEVIDAAVETWPSTVYELIGPMTAQSLKSRRDGLSSIASTYYDLLARKVGVVGSEADEHYEVTRLSADEVRVVLQKRAADGLRQLYHRVFLGDETAEIRLFGVAGNDRIVRYGEADGEPIVHVVGGRVSTVVVDSSSYAAPSDRPEDTSPGIRSDESDPHLPQQAAITLRPE